MGWGIFKKIKDGLSKAVNWVKDKVVKPVYDKVIKPVFNKTKDVIPVAAAAISTAKTGNPQTGLMIGNVIKDVGDSVING